ncbi:hypothetical protein HQ447_08555 [bacterium]|nr:hypothetical protein [bacterium]
MTLARDFIENTFCLVLNNWGVIPPVKVFDHRLGQGFLLPMKTNKTNVQASKQATPTESSSSKTRPAAVTVDLSHRPIPMEIEISDAHLETLVRASLRTGVPVAEIVSVLLSEKMDAA